MLLILDYSGHYSNKLVEVTDEEYQHILKVQGKRYLSDTDEGRELLTHLENRSTEPVSVVAYI